MNLSRLMLCLCTGGLFREHFLSSILTQLVISTLKPQSHDDRFVDSAMTTPLLTQPSESLKHSKSDFHSNLALRYSYASVSRYAKCKAYARRCSVALTDP